MTLSTSADASIIRAETAVYRRGGIDPVRKEGKPETFNFLGFTHICGQSRKNGKFLVLRKSIRKRLLAKLRQVKDELRMRMHQPLAEVGKWLRSCSSGLLQLPRSSWQLRQSSALSA